MRQSSAVLSLVLLVVFALCAQSQLATVTSTAPFHLRGASVTPGQGVPGWPVMSGDKIKAGDAPVILNFPDGSTITVHPGSEIIVTMTGSTPVVKLLAGSATYSLTSLTSLGLVAAGPVTPTQLTGLLTLPNRKPAAGWWIAVAGAGAAAGLGYGIVQGTSGGTPVSASQ